MSAKLSVEDVIATRSRFWKNGYRPIEIWGADQLFNDKGEPLSSPGKQPRGRWRQDAARDPPTAAIRAPDPRALNTGIVTGGIVAPDIDVRRQDLVDQIIAIFEQVCGTTPLVRIGQAPKTLLVYRTEKPFPKLQTAELFFPGDDKITKVEILADGQQFVAHGIHPDTDQPYYWTDRCPATVPVTDLPPVTEDQLKEVVVKAEQLLRGAGAVARDKKNEHVDRALGSGFFRNVNNEALANIGSWARSIFPRAKFEPGTGAWRVTSKDLGRDLEEDISIAPSGIRDWGEELRLTPVDLVMRYVPAGGPTDSALWLCDRLGIDPETLGYTKPPPTPPDPEPPDPEPPPIDFDFGVVFPTDTDLDTVPPRPWIYGTKLQRGHVAVLSGMGGGGKSSYAMTVSVELAAYRELLKHHLWLPQTRVWWCGLDDPLDEHFRRLRAILLHHRLTLADLGGGLAISGRNSKFIIANRNTQGGLIATPVVEAIIAKIKAERFDVVVVDPFVRCHAGEENSNPEMAAVMELWTTVAQRTKCAVLLLHHVRKGLTDADDQFATRGASAIIDLARTGLVLAKMSKKEAAALDIAESERRFCFRIGHPKANMAPPPLEAEWYRLVSVPIGNGSGPYPGGDHVQAVECFEPPPLLSGLSATILLSIFNRLRNGPEPGEKFSPTRRGKTNDRWAGTIIVELTNKTDAQAAALIKEWKANHVIEIEDYYSHVERKPMQGVTLNEVKVAEMVGGAAAWQAEC